MTADVQDSPKRTRVIELTPQPQYQDIADTFAEDVVIGSVLNDPQRYLELSEVLQAADFTEPMNAFAWHEMERLFDADKPIEVLSVANAIKPHFAENVELETLIAGLNNTRVRVPQNGDPAIYAQKVQDCAERIRIMKVCEKTMTNCRDNSIGNEAIKDEHETELSASYTQQKHDNPIASARAEKFRQLIQFGEGVRYTDVGLPWQVRSGRATILAGFSGTGKTTLMLSMARIPANQGGVVILFVGEQDPVKEIMLELIAQESGIWRKKLDKRIPMDANDQNIVEATIDHINTWNMFIFGTEDLKRFSPAAIKRKIKKIMREYGYIDFVGIDGLWLTKSDSIGDRRQEWEIIQENNQKINAMARELDIPVLMTHQYSAEYKNANKPELYLLQAGQRIHNDIPEALALWRKSDDVLLYHLKQRGGMPNKDPWKLHYNVQYARYEYHGEGESDESVSDVPF